MGKSMLPTLGVWVVIILLIMISSTYISLNYTLQGKSIDTNFVISISTLIYAIFTILMFSNMKKSYDSQIFPLVYLGLETDCPNHLYLHASNISKNPAKRIEISVRLFPNNWKKHFANIKGLGLLFSKKIFGKEIHFLVGNNYAQCRQDIVDIAELLENIGISITKNKEGREILKVEKEHRFILLLYISYSSIYGDIAKDEYLYEIEVDKSDNHFKISYMDIAD